MKHEQYNVDDAWPIEEPSNIDDCLEKLVILSHSGNKIECHGASKLKHNRISTIRSKFDIRFSENDKNKKGDEKKKEKSSLSLLEKRHLLYYRQRLANLLMLLV